jgi:serine/threonine protein kinase/lipopolysaccharide biosynthesis regulator YciM
MIEESLFAAALERPTAADRRAFLREACAGDEALRQRLERLLAAHERTLGILDQPAVPPGSLGDTDGSPLGREIHHGPRAGTVVAGRYKLLEEIGTGGMGTVWVAEQTQPVRRKVALKLIKSGMDSKSVMARFDAERQALALMDHPNIAKVLDGGVTEGGRPFFVMEYVKGVPLTQYCDDARLGIAERLALFVPICQAVQHAHTKGIVHRDLKPSNILVCLYDGHPVPKVIDFGLAKAMRQPLTELTLHTAHDVMLGTPLYMSPEQAELNNLDVDARTDIYALGVILYELLTGTTPLERQRFKEAAWHELLRLIREEDPPRPSARLSGSASLPSVAAQRQLDPSRLTRLVRGDLDWIVMKCLEKDRSRRYDTASALASDIRRHLADESVEACPPSATYRLGKFARRHRWSMSAGVVFLALLIVGVVAATWGMIQSDRARKAEAARADAESKAAAEAQRRLRDIEKASEILVSVFTDIDPNTEEKEGRPLRAVLADRLTHAADQLEGDAVGDRLLVAGLQTRLGESLLNLGMIPRAIPLLEKARATRAASLGAEHPDTLFSTDILAASYRQAGQLDRAVPLLEEMVRVRKAKMGPDHPDTLTSMNYLATGYRAAGKTDEAVRLNEETVKLREAKLGRDHPETLASMNGLAVSYRAAGKTDEALRLFEEVLRLRRAKLGPTHPETLVSMNNLGSGYQDAGKLERALPLYEEVLTRVKALLGPDHPNTLTCMANLASAYRAAGKTDQAIQLHEEALRLRKAKLGPDHPDTLGSMTSLGTAYLAAKRPDRAIPLFEESYERLRTKLGPDHPDTLISMNGLAAGYRDAGQLDRAIPLMEETLKLRRAKLGVDHPQTLNSMNVLARGYLAAGKLDEALPLLEETLELRESKLGADHPDTLFSKSNLAEGYRDSGQMDRALRLLREATAAIEANRFNHPGSGEIVDNLARALEQSKQPGEAEVWRRKWMAVVKDRNGAESPGYAAALSSLGANLLLQEKWADAESSLRESLALLEKAEPDAWPTSNARSLLGDALLGQEKYAEAEPLLIQGYEGLNAREAQIPRPARGRVAEAGERLVRLYEAWGRPEKAAEWRAKLPNRSDDKPGA